MWCFPSLLLLVGIGDLNFLKEALLRLEKSRIKGSDEVKVMLEYKEQGVLTVEYDAISRVVEMLAIEKRKRLWSEICSGLRSFHEELVKAGSLGSWAEGLHRSVVEGRYREYIKGIKGLGRKTTDENTRGSRPPR